MLARNDGKIWRTAEDYFYSADFLKPKNIAFIVPEDFDSDGASIPTPLLRFFSRADIDRGFIPGVLHDFLCRNQEICKRTDATKILVHEWAKRGLGSRWYTRWKRWAVFASVELYWILRGWGS